LLEEGTGLVPLAERLRDVSEASEHTGNPSLVANLPAHLEAFFVVPPRYLEIVLPPRHVSGAHEHLGERARRGMGRACQDLIGPLAPFAKVAPHGPEPMQGSGEPKGRLDALRVLPTPFERDAHVVDLRLETIVPVLLAWTRSVFR